MKFLKRVWRWITRRVSGVAEIAWKFLKESVSTEYEKFIAEWKDVVQDIVIEIENRAYSDWRAKRDTAFELVVAEFTKRGLAIQVSFINNLIEDTVARLNALKK